MNQDLRNEIVKSYLEKINEISDDLEDKSSFSPQELVEMVIDILENKGLINEA